jgi:hypothetical protein
VVILGIGFLWYQRSQELFVISIRGGKQSVIRGHAPQGLVSQFADAVKRLDRAELRARKTQRGARLSCHGVDEGTAQRLRNIFGLFPMSQLCAPHVDARRIASDAFTLSWLLALVRQFFRF